jgi:molybdenum cofactor guanylyltransferase
VFAGFSQRLSSRLLLSPLKTKSCQLFDSFGPLAGIATGLQAISKTPSINAAFVTACDAPLLKPEFIKAIANELLDNDVAVPTDGEHVHVLSAAYRVSLATTARNLIESGKRRPLTLLEGCSTKRIPVETLKQVDPTLDSLRNTNTPEAYEQTLRLAFPDESI